MNAAINFALSALNVALALAVPSHPLAVAMNWFAAVFCFGIGILLAVERLRR